MIVCSQGKSRFHRQAFCCDFRLSSRSKFLILSTIWGICVNHSLLFMMLLLHNATTTTTTHGMSTLQTKPKQFIKKPSAIFTPPLYFFRVLSIKEICVSVSSNKNLLTNFHFFLGDKNARENAIQIAL